jgi:hypothetical protein
MNATVERLADAAIKAVGLLGQASKAHGLGMIRRQQTERVLRFREGRSSVLVSSSCKAGEVDARNRLCTDGRREDELKKAEDSQRLDIGDAPQPEARILLFVDCTSE